MLFPSSSFSLAIRVKERECVSVVFEGDKVIQVTTSLSSFHLLVFVIYFYFLVVVQLLSSSPLFFYFVVL